MSDLDTRFLPKKDYAAYIFDCDGTLADSMPLHYEAWTHALKVAGADFTFPYELMCQWGGKSLKGTVEGLNEMHGSKLEVEAVRRAVADYIDKHLPKVQPRTHIVAIARKLAQTHPVSVASGGQRVDVHTTLNAIGVRDIFPAQRIITADDVTYSKPAPDIFLLAAERMGVPPKQCLVYEDSPTGIQAAIAAGMDHVVVD